MISAVSCTVVKYHTDRTERPLANHADTGGFHILMIDAILIGSKQGAAVSAKIGLSLQFTFAFTAKALTIFHSFTSPNRFLSSVQ
jgi:hypothetical protein